MKTFPNKILTKSQAEQALDTAIALVRRNLPLYTDTARTIPASMTSIPNARTTSGPAASGPARSG